MLYVAVSERLHLIRKMWPLLNLLSVSLLACQLLQLWP